MQSLSCVSHTVAHMVPPFTALNYHWKGDEWQVDPHGPFPQLRSQCVHAHTNVRTHTLAGGLALIAAR